MPFQPSSDEGILRKGSFTVSVTILLIVILPTQKLYDKECCDSLQAIYFNVISKWASAAMNFLKWVSFFSMSFLANSNKLI